MTDRKYECPPIDQHLAFGTEEQAEHYLQKLRARPHTGPGWTTWYFRNGRTIYSQIQVPIEQRAPRRDWALETLIRMQEAGIIPHPYATPTIDTPAGPQHILF